MTPERAHQASTELAPQALEAYTTTFFSRTDVYAIQREDGRYRCIKEPLTQDLIAAHLYGDITLGTYALDSHSQARWLCLDADTQAQWDATWDMARALRQQGVPSYLEGSRRGGHLWLFFSPLPGEDVRMFGCALINQHKLEGIELFPKQDQLRTGPGSLVRLPLGIHRKDGFRYYFLNSRGDPLAATVRQQMELLATPDLVPEEFIADVLLTHQAEEAVAADLEVSATSPISPDEPLSTRLKASISAQDFITRYVELDPRGRGLCPFHEDQHASFSVDLERDYWNCFAGCGGGSIIDFWMKWRATHGEDPGFVATLKDLANMLL